eukprot:8689683-Karenia_brevis.AAC.1
MWDTVNVFACRFKAASPANSGSVDWVYMCRSSIYTTQAPGHDFVWDMVNAFGCRQKAQGSADSGLVD